MTKRMRWGYPVKNRKKAEYQLKRDLKYYGGNGYGNCAKLDERNPLIIEKIHKGGSIWFHTEVDDILLDLELE